VCFDGSQCGGVGFFFKMRTCWTRSRSHCWPLKSGEKVKVKDEAGRGVSNQALGQSGERPKKRVLEVQDEMQVKFLY